MSIDLSVTISLVALLLSLTTIYLQWFKIRGAIINLLNADERQRAILRSYDGLPETTRQHFPNYTSAHPGYAIARLMFANSGDRTGLTKITNIAIEPTSDWPETDQIQLSYYTHTIVSASGIAPQDIILRNIPRIDTPKDVTLLLGIEWGGPSLRKGKYHKKGRIEQRIKLAVFPPRP